MAAKFLNTFLTPQKLHLIDNCKKSPLRYLFENVLGKTQQAVRDFLRKPNKLSIKIGHPRNLLHVESFSKGPHPKSRLFRYRPGSIANLTSKWVSDSIAARVNREWRRKVLQRGGAPMLGFVGFVLAKKPSLLTEDEERESISFGIRDAFSTIPWQDVGLTEEKKHHLSTDFSLRNLKFGDMLAKGCNAAVYSALYEDMHLGKPSSLIHDVKLAKPYVSVAKKVNKKEDEKPQILSYNETLTDLKLFISHSEEGINSKPMQEDNLENKNILLSGEFHPFNLAVKIMFNYSAESNSFAIFNAMHKEVLPALAGFSLEDDYLHLARKKRLKPHPNIVEMYFAFADMIPSLPGARQYFPQALPARLLEDGCGRNMTLFLVMKRYHCSLKDYLEKYKPSPHTSLLLFTQLLEALVHLYQSNIAHRDLKTDNILLDLTLGVDSPLLAITDFGCCVESLNINYPTYEISKGGNMTLMAPEVINAEAGILSTIDYSRSDLWTAGTIAYEIFGDSNPFYSKQSNLRNSSYKENDLPPFPACAPVAVQKLVKDILQKDSKKRPSQTLAATICQILLHVPANVLYQDKNKNARNTVVKWMFLLSAKTFLEGFLKMLNQPNLEFVLRHTFCSRIQYLEVVKALLYILE